MTTLTDDQRFQLIRRSTEAQAFIRSELFQELEKWVVQEQAATTSAIVRDIRSEATKNLHRDVFVERMCAYYEALPLLPGFFKGLAAQQAQLEQIDDGKLTGTGHE